MDNVSETNKKQSKSFVTRLLPGLFVAAIIIIGIIGIGLLHVIFPSESSLYEAEAMLFIKLHDYESAIKCLGQAIDKGDKNSFVYQLYYEDRAHAYEKLGKHKEAISDFTQVINAIDKDIPPPFRTSKWCIPWHVQRANDYMILGQYNEAVKDYSDVLSVEPENGSVYFARGLAYNKLGKSSLATSDWDKAKRLGYSPKYGVE